jgi:hypothetical protein
MDQDKRQAIIDGTGIGNIVVGKSTAKDVVEQYGDGFRLIHHNRYSSEMSYDLAGMSFYYKFGAKRQVIVYICLRAPYKGETTKGIVLGEHTMRDVFRVYGPRQWTTSEGSETFYTEYAGVEFHVEKERNVPEFPVDTGTHIVRPIIQVGIRIAGRDQCKKEISEPIKGILRLGHLTSVTDYTSRATIGGNVATRWKEHYTITDNDVLLPPWKDSGCITVKCNECNKEFILTVKSIGSLWGDCFQVVLGMAVGEFVIFMFLSRRPHLLLLLSIMLLLPLSYFLIYQLIWRTIITRKINRFRFEVTELSGEHGHKVFCERAKTPNNWLMEHLLPWCMMLCCYLLFPLGLLASMIIGNIVFFGVPVLLAIVGGMVWYHYEAEGYT